MTYPILSRNKLAPLLVLTLGCADLDLIGADVCGNHVVEPHVHEECDGPVGCGAPETAAACRFSCEGGASCPDGYRCGVDGICRKPSGQFEVLRQTERDVNRDVVVSDADGDGRADVLRVVAEHTFLEFYGDGGVLETVSTLGHVPYLIPSAAVLDLDGDGLRDVAINAEGVNDLVNALAVYRLQPDRSFESTVYASLAIPGSSLRSVRAQVLPPEFDDEVLAFVDGTLIGVDRAVDPEPVAHGTSHVADALDGMVAARFNETALCDYLAVGDGGGLTISIINPCVETGNPMDPVRWRAFMSDPPDPPDVTTVTLPEALFDYAPGNMMFGHKDLHHALFAADWNSDGHIDLVAVPKDLVTPRLLVAFGQGDGTFHSQPVPVAGPDGLATNIDLTIDYPAVAFTCVGPGGTPKTSRPTPVAVLALADFNGDSGLDLVREDGIYFRGGPVGSATCSGFGWRSAEVGDFDGNGIEDVAAARYGNGIDYLGSAGDGAFARTTLDTQGLVMQLLSGDYDGDLADDLAFFELMLASNSPETSLSVAFGRGMGGAPEQPVTVGRVDGIAHLTSARFLRGDSISDLGVLARNGGSQALALVAGNSRRELSAPFLLNLEIEGHPDRLPQSIDVVTTGNFGEGRGPIVAMARDEYASNPGGRNRPWLLNVAGNAEITAALSSAYHDRQEGVICAHAVNGVLGSCPAAAVDLDGDGIDELVVFASDEQDKYQGRVHTFVLGEEAFELMHTLDIGPLRVEASDAIGSSTRAFVVDLDGDGLRDILVEGHDTQDFTAVLLAFYNNGDGTLTQPWRMTNLEPTIEALSLIELDGDPQVEIAMGKAGQLSFWEATSDRTIVSVTTEVGIIGPPPEPLHIASGDVDGDGVEDMVVAGFLRYALLRGLPVTP